MSRPILEQAFVAPRSAIESQLADMWGELLNIERVGIQDNFFELGGHSLKATQVVSRIRDTFQIELPLRRLFETPTIAGLAEYIEASFQQPSPTRAKTALDGENRFSSLVPIQPHGSKLPFFLVPGVGGSEEEFLIYAQLIHLLGPEQPVYGFYARGLLDDQPAHCNVETMAADYLQEMRTVQPQGPYLLGGECIGGRVAYEMARQLQAQGQEIAILLLMNTSLLQIQMSTDRIDHLHRQVTRQQWRVQRHLSQLQPLSFAKRLHYMGQTLHNWQIRWLPLTASQRTMQQMQRIRVNYSHLLQRYRPQQSYSGPIILLVSEDHYQKNPTMGWRTFALGGLGVYSLPGEHDSYIGEHVETTASQLRACLATAQESL